jgi:hypothetical protein
MKGRKELLILAINTFCDESKIDDRYRMHALSAVDKCYVIGTRGFHYYGRCVQANITKLAEGILHCAIQDLSRYTCPLTQNALLLHNKRIDRNRSHKGSQRMLLSIRSLMKWECREEPTLTLSAIKALGISPDAAEDLRSLFADKQIHPFMVKRSLSRAGISAAITFLYLTRKGHPSANYHKIGAAFHVDPSTVKKRVIEIIDGRERY